MQAATTALKVKIVVNGMLLHVYQFTEIILLPLSQKGNGVADHRAFYPVTSKGNRYCGKVFSAITKRHYTRRLVQRISQKLKS
jgi:hypothetical protein